MFVLLNFRLSAYQYSGLAEMGQVVVFSIFRLIVSGEMKNLADIELGLSRFLCYIRFAMRCKPHLFREKNKEEQLVDSFL